MVVGGEPGLGEPLGLGLRQHAERDAGLHAELRARRCTMSSTRSNLRPSLTSRQAAPMQKRVAPASLASARLGQHVVDVEQLFALEPGLLGVMRRLRAIGAVLRAAAGLDRQQARQLNRAVLVMAAMHRAGLVEQLEQRHRQQANNLVPRPVVACHGLGSAFACRSSRALLAVERIRAFLQLWHGSGLVAGP